MRERENERTREQKDAHVVIPVSVSASCYGRKQKLCHAAKLLREAIALEGVPRRVHAGSVIARVNLAAAMLQLNRFATSSY